MPPAKDIVTSSLPKGKPGVPPRPTKPLRRWWAALAAERNGRARYTVKQLEKIRDSDERRNPFMKRIAASHILMMLEGGRSGLEVLGMIFDRTEGKVPLRVDMTVDEQPKRIILIDRSEVVATQVAGELEVHDVPKVLPEALRGDDSGSGSAVDAG